jgi:hypothetical protein
VARVLRYIEVEVRGLLIENGDDFGINNADGDVHEVDDLDWGTDDPFEAIHLFVHSVFECFP